MTIGIGKFNRSSNFLGPGPKKCRNKSLDFSEFQLVFGSPILFTYVGIEEPSTAKIPQRNLFRASCWQVRCIVPPFFPSHLDETKKRLLLYWSTQHMELFCFVN